MTRSKLVEVLEVEINDAAFQLLNAGNGIEARTHPVARVGTGADPLAVTLAHLQYRIGVPVTGRFWMIVDGKVHAILVAQLVDRLEGIRTRLGDELFDAHFLGEIKVATVMRILNPIAAH